MDEDMLELDDFVRARYFEKFPGASEEDYERDLKVYQNIPAFGANENIYQIGGFDEPMDTEGNYIEPTKEKLDIITPGAHWILRTTTHFYLRKAFEAMRVNLEDPNIAEYVLNKGTPGRIAKTWVGADLDDTSELGSGRFNREPYISRFPNTNKEDSVITKEVNLVSCCSHHFLPFSNLDGGKAIIAYRPTEYVLGISKLQRFVNWVASRFWLQEDLTRRLGEEIKRIAETEDVYVRLEGIKHSCERFRGIKAADTTLTTEYRSGMFKCENNNEKEVK